MNPRCKPSANETLSEKPRCAIWQVVNKLRSSTFSSSVRAFRASINFNNSGPAINLNMTSVASADDEPICRITSPPLSSVIINDKQRGYQAASEIISTANQMLDTLMHMKG